MTNEEEKYLEGCFKDHLQKQFNRGLLVGTQAIAGTILKKTMNKKSVEEKLSDIIDFCNVSLNLNVSDD